MAEGSGSAAGARAPDGSGARGEAAYRGAPPELRDAIRAALETSSGRATAGGAGASDSYARAALAQLDRLLARGEEGRPVALELLAADACLVAAFEAAAEEGADLRELAERLGPRGELGRRLEAMRPTRGPAGPEGSGGRSGAAGSRGERGEAGSSGWTGDDVSSGEGGAC